MTAALALPQIEIVYRDGHSFIGAYGNVLVGVSSGRSGYAGLEHSYKLHERLRATYPEGFAKIIVSAGGAKMPTAEEREKINRLATEFAPSTLAIALVFEGDGMWFSSMRVVTKAMMLAIPRQFPQTIFATVAEAAPWIAKQCGSAARFDAPGLVAGVDAIR